MRPVSVGFWDPRLKKAYDQLKKGKFEDRELAANIDTALDDLKKNPYCGFRIPDRLTPKSYRRLFPDLDNLWKYDLPNAWRLVYSIVHEEVRILAVILEWMSHKEYERRFGYNQK